MFGKFLRYTRNIYIYCGAIGSTKCSLIVCFRATTKRTIRKNIETKKKRGENDNREDKSKIQNENLTRIHN